jgi:polyhydroxyalkanoate synthesis regulator phasin
MKDKKPLQEMLRETWMNALGVLHTAEGELSRVAARWIDLLGKPKEGAQQWAQDLQQRMRRNREVFEQKVEEGVRTAAERVRVPLVHEVSVLRARVEKLSERIDQEAARRRERRAQRGQ